MQLIKDYVNSLVDEGIEGGEIAQKLGVSVSMVSSYKLHSYNPSLQVAKHVYETEGIVFHPFSEDSLKYEIEKDKK